MEKTNLKMNKKIMPAAVAVALLLAGAGAAQVAYAAEDDATETNLFKEGVYQREQGNLFTSIEALQTVLSNAPTLNRARLELAVAYYRTLNFEKAKQEAQVVLDDPKTPENVRISVLAFLAQVKKDEEAYFSKRNVWEPSIAIGLIHDSNANYGPSSDILPGGLTLAPGARSTSDQAYELTAGILHRYQSPTPVKIGEKAARFVWQSQASLYRKQYFSLHDYNFDDLSLSTGPGWYVPQFWRANVSAQVDYLRFGDTELGVFTGVSPSFTWEMNNGEVTLDGLFQNRKYSRDVDAGRDSNYSSVGVSVGKLFKAGKYAVQAGVHVFNESADRSYYSNNGTDIFLAGNMVAWNNGSVYGRITERDSRYDGVDPSALVKRDERQFRYEVGFNHDYKQGVLNHWRLNGSYGATTNTSNAANYDYNRNVTSLNMSRTF